MKTSNARKSIFLVSSLLFCTLFAFSGKITTKDIYEIRVYTLKNESQISRLDNYLKSAFIPAMHRFGVKKIGVFKIVGLDTAHVKKMYVLIPFKSVDQWRSANSFLNKDQIFENASNEFTHADAASPSYERMESIITEAFPGSPNFEIPNLQTPKSERIYELRSYESPTEHLFERKVTMFNKGDEIGLFKRLGFNAVFYSSVISGDRMPNLMYMICFESMTSHDQHWKQFVNDPQWKNISTMPEYENKVSVSHIDSLLMHAADYSEI